MNENNLPNDFIDNEKVLLYDFIMGELIWKNRWSKEQIRAMLIEQSEFFWQRDTGIEREKLLDVERASQLPHAVIISGLRRVGKSTLLAQMAHKLGKDTFYYINFEDDRFLGFQAQDANDLYQSLVEVFGERKIFIIDEIQNVEGWEHFVRRFMDWGFKFYISGSNAALLSRELGTRLTGRHVPLELFPFSFREYLQFRGQSGIKPNHLTTVEKAQLNASLDAYIQEGGIADALKYSELSILKTLYEDVLFRDIATRYRLESVQALKELGFLLMSNPSGLVSFNKLKEHLRLGSVNTVSNYVENLENSWLLFTTRLYDFSVKRQQVAAKKVYGIDTGLVNAVGFHFSPNIGKLMENLVFLALRRRTKEIFYYVTAGGYEVDFYLPEKRELIQVSQHLNNPATREREVRALEDANKALDPKSLLILSNENEDPIKIGKKEILVRAIPEWLLD